MVEKRGRPSRKERARAEILEAAREVVLARGLADFTLEDVARELGLTKAALYYYYRSKDALAFALFLNEWQRAAEAVDEATRAETGGIDALAALVRAYVEHYSGRPELFLLTHSEVARGDNTRLIGPRQLERIRPLNDLFYGAVERKLEHDLPEVAADEGRARRLAVVGHLAAVGLLTLKTLVESVGDPLLHSDEVLVDEITGLLRAALGPSRGEDA